MKVLLNCSSYSSLKSSIANVFNSNEREITDCATKFEFEPSESDSSDLENITRIFWLRFGGPKEYEILIFHGTRTDCIDSIKKNGLLPRNQAKGIIKEKFESLSLDVICTESQTNLHYHNRRKNEENNIEDEGPCGFLFKEAIEHSDTHSFYEVPELHEEIANEIVGGNYSKVIEKYQKQSKSYVISFKTCDDINNTYLKLALMRLVYMENNIGSSFPSITWAFSNSGKAIRPEDIFDIEELHLDLSTFKKI